MEDTSDIYVDTCLKIILLGDSGVGKTCISSVYCNGLKDYTDSFVPTIGIDFKYKHVKYQDATIKLQIWDSAGQERFRSLTRSFYRGVKIVLYVYDIGDRTTFDHIPSWLREFKQYGYNYSDCLFILVGNKSDLYNGTEYDSIKKRRVTFEQGQELATQLNMAFFEVSSKRNHNIQELFEYIVQHGNKYIYNVEYQIAANNIIRLADTEENKSRFCPC